ncbi:DUF4382 domain-containing protein [Halalkalicoccus sp. NIPERK01]|uniref:DUF4382 domain-containing protein n=1 Tax=Halalkalicoccus sp. NIPERK01 TaxID=3053469 RepID=UPI00256F2DDD|nr:DUF4382 domain-containing protein [Halalkalicoccus sp. NIPERK01]MDL5361785.1 DUF4382 domain-containing protein [Halalkalicoccus sp. NIPERK01]
MDRRRYIEAAGAAVLGSVLAGCAASSPGEPSGENDTNAGEAGGTDPNEAETGTLATSVTDQPADIDDFESCVVTIDGIWVKPSDADDEGDEVETPGNETDEDEPEDPEGDAQANESSESEEGDEEGEGEDEGDEDGADESEGRRYIEFDEPQEADLVRLQGANTQLIDETELAAGEYRFLQLDVSGVEGTLADGGEAEVETPGNAPLQFKRRFEIRADEVTRFVADFAPVRRGRANRYLIKPVATGTRVLYGDEEYDPEAGDDSEPGGSDDASEADDGDGGTDGDERAPDDAGSGN